MEPTPLRDAAAGAAYAALVSEPACGQTLLELARGSVEHGLRRGGPLEVDLAALADPLRRPAASFVTLRRADGDLRGCIGELEPRFALAESVARNAWNAAFRDPRFAPVAAAELAELAFHVSVLGPLEPLAAGSRAELGAALRPGIDGLLIDDGVHRATFLPAVWQSLPEPERFVLELLRKAGLAVRPWPAGLRAWRYAALEIPAPD
jgi:AmmeMemoRadiSam system protein A